MNHIARLEAENFAASHNWTAVPLWAIIKATSGAIWIRPDSLKRMLHVVVDQLAT